MTEINPEKRAAEIKTRQIEIHAELLAKLLEVLAERGLKDIVAEAERRSAEALA